MNYEEKLNKILFKLKEERKLTRKSHKTKVTFDDRSFTKVRISDICKILLKLQDDEKILTISKAYQDALSLDPFETSKDDYDNTEVIIVELEEKFDNWYENYLLKEKSKLENLSKKNFNNIAHIAFLIEEELELAQSKILTISFVADPYEIEGYDSFDIEDLRNTYTRSLLYLKNIGVIKSFSKEPVSLHSEIILNITKFLETLKQIKNLKGKNHTSQPKKTILKTTNKKVKTKQALTQNKINWPKDFKWKGKKFIFGKFGSISFNSKHRKHIFKTLTGKKGSWATINELKGNKDAGYVRSTIKQIEDRLPEKAKKHIIIISTQDDDSEEKPDVGAYRIKVLPQPKPL